MKHCATYLVRFVIPLIIFGMLVACGSLSNDLLTEHQELEQETWAKLALIQEPLVLNKSWMKLAPEVWHQKHVDASGTFESWYLSSRRGIQWAYINLWLPQFQAMMQAQAERPLTLHEAKELERLMQRLNFYKGIERENLIDTVLLSSHSDCHDYVRTSVMRTTAAPGIKSYATASPCSGHTGLAWVRGEAWGRGSSGAYDGDDFDEHAFGQSVSGSAVRYAINDCWAWAEAQTQDRFHSSKGLGCF